MASLGARASASPVLPLPTSPFPLVPPADVHATADVQTTSSLTSAILLLGGQGSHPRLASLGGSEGLS